MSKQTALNFGDGTVSVDVSRRRELIDIRNRVLVARYYYWSELRRRRFDDVLNILSTREFFVCERTVTNTLNDLDAYLNELLKNKPGHREMEREYPSWGWERGD